MRCHPYAAFSCHITASFSCQPKAAVSCILLEPTSCFHLHLAVNQKLLSDAFSCHPLASFSCIHLSPISCICLSPKFAFRCTVTAVTHKLHSAVTHKLHSAVTRQLLSAVNDKLRSLAFSCYHAVEIESLCNDPNEMFVIQILLKMRIFSYPGLPLLAEKHEMNQEKMVPMAENCYFCKLIFK